MLQDLFPALPFLEELRRDLGGADAGKRPPGKLSPRIDGQRLIKLALQRVFRAGPILIVRNVDLNAQIPRLLCLLRIPGRKNLHLIVRKKSLHQRVQIIKKIFLIYTNANLHALFSSFTHANVTVHSVSLYAP